MPILRFFAPKPSRKFAAVLALALATVIAGCVTVAAIEVGRRPNFEGETVFAQLPLSAELYFTAKLTKNVGGN